MLSKYNQHPANEIPANILLSIEKHYLLAERHFNVAALQSQKINPKFSCFAYRYLADIPIKNNRLAQ